MPDFDKLRQHINNHRRRWLVAVAIFFLGLTAYHFIVTRHKTIPIPPVEVVTAKAKQKNMPVYLLGLGAVTPVDTVTVRTQINGQLMQVFFKEGQIVKAGERIALIDPSPYLADLIQNEGQLVRDTALLQNAKIDLKRYQTLWNQDSVSQQILATQQSLVTQYEGAVQLDQGLIKSTKVNLSYCNITSPVDGRIGLRLVDPGNFVQTSDTNGIAVITTLNPITVIFPLPEDNIPEIVAQLKQDKTLRVLAYDRSQTTLLSIGKLLTIDNEVDPTTGTVKLRAQFNNEQGRLFPNQFVNVKLRVKILTGSVVVPTAAIQRSTEGNFVYQVNPDSTVSMKRVKVKLITGDEAVIAKGLSVGQTVVIDGVDQLAEGAKIAVANSLLVPSASHPNKKVERNKQSKSEVSADAEIASVINTEFASMVKLPQRSTKVNLANLKEPLTPAASLPSLHAPHTASTLVTWQDPAYGCGEREPMCANLRVIT